MPDAENKSDFHPLSEEAYMALPFPAGKIVYNAGEGVVVIAIGSPDISGPLCYVIAVNGKTVFPGYMKLSVAAVAADEVAARTANANLEADPGDEPGTDDGSGPTF